MIGCILLAGGALASQGAVAEGPSAEPVSKLGGPSLPHADIVKASGEGDDVVSSIGTREKAAESLYADARAYANLAEWEAAQRILEVIVHQYPDTETARVARADMQKIVERLIVQGHRFSLGRSPDENAPPELAVPLEDSSSAWQPTIRR